MSWEDFCFLMPEVFCTGYFLHGKAAEHSMIIKQMEALGFGRNDDRQLGDGTTTNRNTPTMIISSGVAQVACGHKHTSNFKTDGSLWTFGQNSYGQPGNGNTTNRSAPLQIHQRAHVCRNYHSLVLKTWSLWVTKSMANSKWNTTNLRPPTQILTSRMKITGGYFSLTSKTQFLGLWNEW